MPELKASLVQICTQRITKTSTCVFFFVSLRNINSKHQHKHILGAVNQARMPLQCTVGLCGSVAERSKALVLGTSRFGGVGSNPTAASYILYNVR